MAEGTPDARPFAGHDGPVYCVAFSPDGTTLATGGGDGAVRLWNPDTGQQADVLTMPDGPDHLPAAVAAAYSPDGGTLAISSDDATLWLWNTVDTSVLRTYSTPTGYVRGLAYSPDGTTLATGDGGGVVRLWNLDTDRRVAEEAELARHSSTVNAVAYSPDGSMLASGARSVRIWNLADQSQITQLTAHSHDINDAAWSPDGSMLATAAGGVRVWDAATWHQVAKLTGHGSFVGACAWSPGGTTLATASRVGTIRLWDTATWRPRAELTGHTTTVRGLAWSPDGALLASVGHDGTIRIWNPKNGTQINGTGFEAPPGPARPLAGVQSDSPSGDDLLGIGDDVETLAELIAATETSPPLAIALIGDWGTGKSSAMLQVERHVGELAQRSRNNPGRSAFAANVRQVRFNAWHYSDDHLWTGIVSHLFTALAGSPDAPDSDSPDPGAAAGDAGSADDQRKIAAQRDRLRARLGEKRTARDRLARDLAAADDVPRPQGPLGWLGSPVQAGQVLITAVRQAFRDTRAALPALAAWIVLGVGAYLAWRFLGQPAAGAVTAIAALAPPAVTVARNLRSGHDAILRWAERERSRLAARQRGYDQEIKDLRDRLVLIDAAARLDRFLDDRGQAGSYRGYQGLLGQVHADLRELSADLAQARAQWAAEGGIGPPPLERIVLYIDDLDRCPPSRVVKVLDAVHLMLALDLFVVVVAVDARWLIRSLECHHQELFAEGDAGGEAVATPVDYLDKIFQIPFALRPPGPDATARYLRSLLPDPAPPADDTPSSGTLPGHALPGHALPGHALPGDALADGTPAADPPAADSPDAQAPRGAPGPPTPEAIGAPARSGPPNGPGEPDPSRRPEASRVPVPPPATGDDEPKPPVVELRPKSLQLSRPEIEFMTRLGGLLPTPRAAKRLVNIYRLVRIGIPEAELSAFTGDGAPYRAVQVLLAILVGHPKAARTIFTDLLAPDTDDLATVAGKWDETDASFLVIKTELSRLRAERSLTVTAADCQRWCPLLARFSFYTRDLATA